MEGWLGGYFSPGRPARCTPSRFCSSSRLGLFRLLFASVSALFLLDQTSTSPLLLVLFLCYPETIVLLPWIPLTQVVLLQLASCPSRELLARWICFLLDFFACSGLFLLLKASSCLLVASLLSSGSPLFPSHEASRLFSRQ